MPCLALILLFVTAALAQAGPDDEGAAQILALVSTTLDMAERAAVAPNASDFLFQADLGPHNGSANFVTTLNRNTWPILGLLPHDGVALNIFSLAACGTNSIHVHPRATELVYAVSGYVEVGIHEENMGRVLKVPVSAGGTAAIPQGLVHYVYNPTCDPALVLQIFSSTDPGTSTIHTQFFRFPDDVISENLRISVPQVQEIRSKLPGVLHSGPDSCLSRCNE